jgi:hypoxanthine-DNA glycosylase
MMTTTEAPVLNAFAPLAQPDATLLILGSMPGSASLDAHEYYAHPRNSFWHIMQALYGTGAAPATHSEKLKLLHEARIALWDVLAQCRRPGSLDSNIDHSSIVCNDFTTFISSHRQIRTIAFNGRAAEQLFRKHALQGIDTGNIKLVSLPSTSPAMATLSRHQKADVWRERLL